MPEPMHSSSTPLSFELLLDTPGSILPPRLHPKPLFIVTPLCEHQVQATTICAKSIGVLPKIRSGGHNFEGACPTVGGHLSGGGYGNMLRKYGLSVCYVVDLNGGILEENHGEDLFWAIRGGGGLEQVLESYYLYTVSSIP